jgi:hypothetical protein
MSPTPHINADPTNQQSITLKLVILVLFSTFKVLAMLSIVIRFLSGTEWWAVPARIARAAQRAQDDSSRLGDEIIEMA